MVLYGRPAVVHLYAARQNVDYTDGNDFIQKCHGILLRFVVIGLTHIKCYRVNLEK
jgi:hypothetical protein